MEWRNTPPLLFSISFEITSPSSSPLPGTSISMQCSCKEWRCLTVHTAHRDWQCPGHTHKSPRETRLLKALTVRGAPVAEKKKRKKKRRLWLIICSQLKGKENEYVVCPGSSLPPLQRLTIPLILVWGGDGVGVGCIWRLRFISQAAGRRKQS